ncbi:MAG: hypothetical protein KIT84_34105 [Labilithrix sp.]|nr:hypothetical protein [Labilithrix sp.]MCW5816080.1 hypothetical protein [Labilithrix sp.]
MGRLAFVTLACLLAVFAACGLSLEGTAPDGSSTSSTSSTSSSSTSSSSSSTSSSTSSSSSSGSTCPERCGDCPNGVCVIRCPGPGCGGDSITCPDGRPCVVRCEGEDSCKGKEIECPDDAACEVRCSGKTSCAGNNTEVKCQAPNCTLRCTGNLACEDTKIETAPGFCIECIGNGGDSCKKTTCGPATSQTCRRSCKDQACGGGHVGGCSACREDLAGCGPSLLP